MRVERKNIVKTNKKGVRKVFRNVYRKNRNLIGKGYKKVRGQNRVVKMTPQEMKKYNPQTNPNFKRAILKRKIKKHIIGVRKKRTFSSGQYKSLHKK